VIDDEGLLLTTDMFIVYVKYHTAWNRCQQDLNSFPTGELEETTRTPSCYVDEDYPAGPEI